MRVAWLVYQGATVWARGLGGDTGIIGINDLINLWRGDRSPLDTIPLRPQKDVLFNVRHARRHYVYFSGFVVVIKLVRLV